MIGKCHCGRVVFRVDKPPPARGGRCNCSLCARRGWVAESASVDEFELLQGQDVLRSYRFAAGTTENFFCSVCGIHTHFFQRYREPYNYKFNPACCEGVEVDKLEVSWLDGRAF